MCPGEAVRNITHMGDELRGRYREALDLVNVSELARETGRALRTLQAYKYGERRVTDEAARELVDYLEARSRALAAAADSLAAAVSEEGGEDAG